MGTEKKIVELQRKVFVLEKMTTEIIKVVDGLQAQNIKMNGKVLNLCTRIDLLTTKVNNTWSCRIKKFFGCTI